MTEKVTDLPDKHILGDSWGLGWIRFGWDGRRLIGHDGNTIGQAAMLRAKSGSVTNTGANGGASDLAVMSEVAVDSVVREGNARRPPPGVPLWGRVGAEWGG